ncbi:hypothetical protein ABB37_04905 [Leptomonas pyrrhocoris]|uniref:Uncharacterized protein n=1 Tax=Leptomonas pyrrhocoris TaxID=157538 RepID=A0A0N0VEZ9_LEPPY|nr:hypothetical protein ABB37_04905 [Leptomonas pyrrhocoris]KPA79808.1 hypothetical protein ABB37_04905 [Leptomonas pyrrhocoris]|eukprot:XP_015658247.1 hypothetical protein ABB37_04905 [Leptomonas pyrrhocoris]
MGCKLGKTKEQPQNVVSKEADEFYILATTERHPVAQKLLEEWVQFVDAQARRNAGDPTAAQAYENRPKEVWADTSNRPLTHRSVDYVGKMFLEYIKRDLSQRGWGGNFDYKVAGVAKQGFLKANAIVDAANSDVPEDVTWEIKIHYDSSGAL